MRPRWITPFAVAALAAYGCGPGQSPARPPTPGPSGSAGPAVSGGSSAGTPPSSGQPTGCGPLVVVASQRDQPAPVCLRRGATLRVATEPSPRQPWSPPVSSDGSVLRCESRQAAEGRAEAVCTAMGRGTATVSTQTGPFAGDPHGPAQYLWQLTVTVVD